MLRVFRSVVFIILLLGLSRGAGGQASQATTVELGDITEETEAQFLAGEVAAVGDTVSYAFTLSAPRRVALGIRQQDTDADLVVVDASAAEVGRSATAGTANELVRLALGPGSYRAHVVGQAAGVNAYRLRYRVKAVEDDYGADVDTSGTLLVGESTTGAVDYVGDEDWFFIDLEAARTYTLQVAGTASAPVMVGVYAATGTEVTAGVSGLESAVATFTPDTTALYYIAVAATDIQTGAYTLSVTDSTPAPAAEPEGAAPAAPAEAPAVQATDLGDLTDSTGRPQVQRVEGALDGTAAGAAGYQFTLSEMTTVTLELHAQEANADLIVENATGTVVAESRAGGVSNEWLEQRLAAGTYFVRVVAQEAGSNDYALSYGAIPNSTPRDLNPWGQGDLTGLESTQTAASYVGGQRNPVDNRRFTLSETKTVHLLLGDQQGDADLFLETAAGVVVRASRTVGTADEAIEATLAAGTWYVRIALAQPGPAKSYALHYWVSAPGAPGPDAAADAAPMAVELPEGCTLEPLFDTQDGTQRSHWLRPCRSIYSYPRDWEGAYVTGLARYFRMDLLSDGQVNLEVEATTTHHILIRDADGIQVAHIMFDRGAHECYQPCVGRGVPLSAELKAGTYMIEVVQHYSVDLRQRPFTLTVEGDVLLHPAPRLSDLTLNGASISGFDAEEFEYPMDAPLAVVTVGAVASAPSAAADVRIFPADADAETAGHQVNVASADVTEIIVRVSAPDGFLTKEYTVTFFGLPAEDLSLTAKFLRVRLGHGGDYDPFSMRVAFSKPIAGGEAALERALRFHGLSSYYQHDDSPEIRRLGSDENIDLYSIDDILPSRYRTLRVVLPQTTDCGATDAICTDDDAMLSNRVKARVPFKFLGWAEPDMFALPQSDDYAADTSTTGTVAVDGTATGWLHAAGDRDWFGVELEAGTTYRIDAKGDGAGVTLAYALTRSRTSRAYGGTLHDPALVVYDSAGVQVPGASDDNSGEGLNARLLFTPATVGTYYLEIKDPGGIGTYTLGVTEIPQSDDYAADTSTPGTVAVDGTATGWLHADGDRDWFGVELEAGTTYRLDVTGDTAWAYGGTLHDPALVVYDSAGVQVPGASDDNSGEGLNARLLFTPATVGTYYLEIKDPGGIGTYTLGVTEIPQSDDYAADTSTPGTVAVDGTATGWLHADGDRDWFGVELEAGTTYRLDAKGDVARDYGGTLHNPALRVYDAAGVQVPRASNANGGEGQNARLEFTPATAGRYYIEVRGPRGIGTYTLAVTEMEDE